MCIPPLCRVRAARADPFQLGHVLFLKRMYPTLHSVLRIRLDDLPEDLMTHILKRNSTLQTQDTCMLCMGGSWDTDDYDPTSCLRHQT